MNQHLKGLIQALNDGKVLSSGREITNTSLTEYVYEV